MGHVKQKEKYRKYTKMVRIWKKVSSGYMGLGKFAAELTLIRAVRF